MCRRSLIASLLVVAGWLAAAGSSAFGQGAEPYSRERDNLFAVLRDSVGANWSEERLRPMERIQTRLPDGKDVDVEMAWFAFLGDMHVRFVFDGPQWMISAKPDDLRRLDLSPEKALQVAVANLRRVYGKPTVSPWLDGLMEVKGKSSDLGSSYFLDREFWQSLSQEHPEGVVVAVPERGGLLYAPLSDARPVDLLKRRIALLYASDVQRRVSSALYLFKDNQWSVFQAPRAAPPPGSRR